jgi:hypothetical protein
MIEPYGACELALLKSLCPCGQGCKHHIPVLLELRRQYPAHNFLCPPPLGQPPGDPVRQRAVNICDVLRPPQR